MKESKFHKPPFFANDNSLLPPKTMGADNGADEVDGRSGEPSSSPPPLLLL